MEQTLGQRRVMAKFNPSEDSTVELIKNKSAELIDLIEALRDRGVEPLGEALVRTSFSGDLNRACSLAQTKIETACMYAVKANFIS